MFNHSVNFFYSPTKVKLESLDEVRQYLLTEGTCKCGLECPLIVERTFLFDHEVDSKHLCADEVRCDSDLTNLCNHKRKIVAMATFHHSAGLQMEQQNFQSSLNPPQPCKGDYTEHCSVWSYQTYRDYYRQYYEDDSLCGWQKRMKKFMDF